MHACRADACTQGMCMHASMTEGDVAALQDDAPELFNQELLQWLGTLPK